MEQLSKKVAKKRLILDIEADSLSPTKIWVVVSIDVDDTSVKTYLTASSFKVDPDALYIGHNILGYDIPALERLWGVKFNPDNIIDTLVVSRLLNFQATGGHSLERWGERLNAPKGNFKDFSKFSQEMVDYCIQDCEVTKGVFLKLEKFLYAEQWKESLRCEHQIAGICRTLHDNGFSFSYEKARGIHSILSNLVNQLSEQLRVAFPPRAKLIREVTPRETKHDTIARNSIPRSLGDDLSSFSVSGIFSYIEWVDFNPASPTQVVERLNEAGWEPFEKTEGYKDCEKELSKLRRLPKARRNLERIRELEEKLPNFELYGWKVSEENLETLPEDAPEGTSILVKWRMLSKRLQTLEEWFRAYDGRDGRIHGDYSGIGTWTHRMSHSNPNQGNVPSVDSKYHSEELKALAKTYGTQMRSCFGVPDGKVLVGVDADGIQLRVLAHYMDDLEFTQALISGKKEDNTDVHSLNAFKLSGNSRRIDRPRAKTFIYAWLLGAGTAKVSKILGVDLVEAREALEAFIQGYPGLRKLKEEVIPRDAARGYYIGFDGRIIHCDEYHMLAGYLQTGEACIMKHATVDWKGKLDARRYKLVNFVHDEVQVECNSDYADHVGLTFIQSLKDTGIKFNLKCPLDGTMKQGKNWFDTH